MQYKNLSKSDNSLDKHRADPYTTITIPSSNTGTITVGAYNNLIGSLFVPSGRGYTSENRVKPDIIAPGVNIIGHYPNNRYGVMSGTGVATAITAGARGANRKKGMKYPNKLWGYGSLDLINAFGKLLNLVM